MCNESARPTMFSSTSSTVILVSTEYRPRTSDYVSSQCGSLVCGNVAVHRLHISNFTRFVIVASQADDDDECNKSAFVMPVTRAAHSAAWQMQFGRENRATQCVQCTHRYHLQLNIKICVCCDWTCFVRFLSHRNTHQPVAEHNNVQPFGRCRCIDSMPKY